MVIKTLKSITIRIFIFCLILVSGGCLSHDEKKEKWPDKIQDILDNTTDLKFDNGKRLPLYLWPAIDPGVLSDEMAERLIAEMDKRGVGIVCSWSMNDTADIFAQCLPIARAQKKLGQRININATDLLDSFFNGDESTAHLDADGKPLQTGRLTDLLRSTVLSKHQKNAGDAALISGRILHSRSFSRGCEK